MKPIDRTDRIEPIRKMPSPQNERHAGQNHPALESETGKRRKDLQRALEAGSRGGIDILA